MTDQIRQLKNMAADVEAAWLDLVRSTEKDTRRMAKKKKKHCFDRISFLMPVCFIPAIEETAHRFGLPSTAYMRQAVLLRLQADGVDLDKAAR